MSAIQYPLIDAVVVIFTGMVIVFLALIALTFIIKLMGVFSGAGKKAPTAPAVPAAPVAPAAVVPNEEVAAVSAAVAASGISEEEIAVISAAVAATMDGSSSGYTITKITRRVPGERPIWGMAGMIHNTRPC